ncbi:EAL domain-containing protein [Crenobacter sp. SG2303]|uniref:EAL domain-containing protein n=1 Tax=Crenobacter oryzisoli TaxID=3056844 RepID=A0ABT7XS88_9NEIS|nr:EAL domain-containing protein [Crenobacter sp. SG2303]MDN0076656.1 EAL domain-containing protein [Crenobacter sp. SG2303]
MISLLLQPIEHIASTDILSCGPETPIYEAASLMVQSGCGSIVIMNTQGEVLGIWTESDALHVDLSEEASYQHPIQDVMSSPVITLPHSMTVHDAVVKFRQHNIRHALVKKFETIIGMVSLSDVVLCQGPEAFLGLKRVGAINAHPAVILQGSDSLPVAVNTMRQRNLTAVGIQLSDGSFGILTQRDVVRLVATGQRHAELGQVCTRPLVGVPLSTSLLQARQVILHHQIRHLGVFDDHNQLVHIIGFREIIQSIEHEFLLELHEALRERDEALLKSQQSLLLADKVFESTMEGIIITDAKGIIRSINPAFSRITGYSRDEAVGNSPAILKSGKQPPEFYEYLWRCLHQEGSWQGEIVNRRKNGLLYTEHLSITAIRDEHGEPQHYVAVFSDITQRKLAEERLHFLANHDALTGLPNRTLFIEKLQSAVGQAKQYERRFALLFIDLDRFKQVNDTLGHHAGDELLIRIANELQHIVPSLSTVSRLSGDEFTILLENIVSMQQVAYWAQSILDAISAKSSVAGHEVFISSSIGISIFPEDGSVADELLVNADTAMYRAKERGKNNFQFYTADMNASAIERMKLEYGLHRALAKNELEVWYQPKVALDSTRIVGAEALLRWRHPEMGMISPGQFIPIAEESSLITSIGEWVLDTTCADIRSWRDAGLLDGRIAANISGLQLKYSNIVETVSRILKKYDLDSSVLELEITENVAMDEDSGMVEVLHRLQTLGIYLSIDDFGTGYSSLSYLKRLPVRGLKIDQSFIKNLHQDRDDAAITQAIISIARSLGLDLVAEGVELEEQRQFLVEKGCLCGQGFLFSRAVPREEFAELLKKQGVLQLVELGEPA